MRRYLWLLLFVPFVALLWVPFYNAHDPVVWGFPYFYLYMFLWVPIASLLTFVVHRWGRA